jgi:MarR family 2-MHQ and catechol resistance regulon transcriptional repressor
MAAVPRARTLPDRHLAAEIGALLARSRRQVYTRAKARLEQVGESIFVWRLLFYLHEVGPAIQAELADATAQHAGSTSRLLDEMEERGLVRRRRDGEDRRRVTVELTASGRRRYAQVFPHAIGALEESLRALSVEEQHGFAAVLRKLVGA